ncbi:MAG: patatin-like phospholipase family protein, partial [Atopostipes sp.]|nr:patatin-like phospholipase family protein [Atopostipes sp.]
MREGKRQKSFGLSFAGGGVHGWAELAVYEELERQNIEIDAVAGTSMGSFIAAGVASGLTSQEIERIIQETDEAITKHKIFHRRALLNLFSFRQPIGIVLMERIAEIIRPLNKFYGNLMLSDVPKPLAIPAVDLHTGKMIIFSNHPEYFETVFESAKFYDKDLPLLDACLASSAYPVVLSPISIDDYELVDGGVLMNAPAALISKKKIDYVFSIDVASVDELEDIDRWADVALRTISILKEHQPEVIPAEVEQTYQLELDLPGTFDFGDSRKIIDVGREYVRKHPIQLEAL